MAEIRLPELTLPLDGTHPRNMNELAGNADIAESV
jgi:hypothetical protein